MAACAAATEAELQASIDALSPLPATTWLKPAEIGLVMLRGRVGGDGGPFNVGEATVTRAVVQLGTGEVGHGYCLGRNKRKSELAALVDALGLRAADRETLERVLVVPVGERVAAERRDARAETAATRVNFFTLARGED
jgi:alpha-D-ribose 1-methylphosphonate 5-triphosphate synthase subunit PhnG